MVEVLSTLKPLLGMGSDSEFAKLRKSQDPQYYTSIQSRAGMMNALESSLEDQRVVWHGSAKLFGSDVFLILERSRLVVIKGNDVSEICLDKEVFAVKPTNELGQFVVCTLLNKHDVQNYVFTCASVRDSYNWIHLILKIIWFVEPSVSNQAIAQEVQSLPSSELLLQLPQRRILCIVNPFGGDKTALTRFNTECIPILSECPGIVTELVQTERAGHAKDLCETLDLEAWDEIACAGGDGILHECMNGLMLHKNWQKAIKVPICNIPTGTSNALATSILGERSVSLAAFSIARGFTQPLDILSTFQGNQRTYSFLCLMFGFLANVTHKTDFLRKFHIGGLRNKLGAFKELMLKKSYKATLEFVPYKCRDEDLDEYFANDKLRENDHERDVLNEKYMLTRHKLQRTNIYKNREVLSEELAFNKEDASFPYKSGPDCPLLLKYFPECFDHMKDVEEPQYSHNKIHPYDSVTSSQIQTIHDEFFGILSCNTSHIAAGFPLGMASYSNSEFVDLAWIKRENTSRRSFIKHFIKLEQEDDVLMADHESIEFARTQCFKLVPEEEGTVISIDGEEGLFMPTYVEIHPGMMNYIVL